jgi:GTP cyclohydrolase III
MGFCYQNTIFWVETCIVTPLNPAEAKKECTEALAENTEAKKEQVE